MSPAAAVLMADFWIVRRTKWNIPELYEPGGIYWYDAGVNWKAFVAYFLGMWPALPGFVGAVGGIEVAETWTRFYQISFFFGYIVSGGIYIILSMVFPPPGLGVQIDLEITDEIVSDGVHSNNIAGGEKGADVEEKQAHVL